MQFILKKGGKLIGHGYALPQMYDRSAHAPMHMYDACTLDADVTLRDVFLLMNRHIKTFDAIIGNHCEAIVKSGLSKRSRRNTKTDDIDYLELYFEITEEKNFKGDDRETTGLRFPNLHGSGVLKKDSPDGHGKKGDIQHWAIELTEAWKLAAYPLKLRTTVQVARHKSKATKTLTTLSHPECSLGQILYAIIWELSFYGPPVKMMKFRDELKRRIKESKHDKGIPWEEVRAKITKQLKTQSMNQLKMSAK